VSKEDKALRVTGQITSWNEPKCYGFAQARVGGREIFLHANDIVGKTKRLSVSQRVSYIQSTDRQGRACGIAILLDGESLPEGRLAAGAYFSFFVVFMVFVFLMASCLLGYLSVIVVGWHFVLSVITYFVYSKDKKAAQKKHWRIKESTLHLLSLFGGWPGAMIAQSILRHKTKKKEFRVGFWFTVLCNIGLLSWLHTFEGKLMFEVWMLELKRFLS
jgi:uncharacterized membrane protein YsdA (DUF1294 family)/cold shock CspA family protein